jgi:hypothetical protein
MEICPPPINPTQTEKKTGFYFLTFTLYCMKKQSFRRRVDRRGSVERVLFPLKTIQLQKKKVRRKMDRNQESASFVNENPDRKLKSKIFLERW